jgi:hypothetical protein
LQSYDAVSGAASYVVTLKKFPVLPYENNIFFHEGNPSISDFYCNTAFTNGTGVSCNVTDYDATTSLPGNTMESILVRFWYLHPVLLFLQNMLLAPIAVFATLLQGNALVLRVLRMRIATPTRDSYETPLALSPRMCCA